MEYGCICSGYLTGHNVSYPSDNLFVLLWFVLLLDHLCKLCKVIMYSQIEHILGLMVMFSLLYMNKFLISYNIMRFFMKIPLFKIKVKGMIKSSCIF